MKGPGGRRKHTKGDKRDRTRRALIEAARAVSREKGFDAATLEEIAKRAGMTTGAIYGNFKDRDDLFLAMSEAYWAPINPKVEAGASSADVMRAIAEATIKTLPERAKAAAGYYSGRAYAMKHKALRARATAYTAEQYEAGEAWLKTVLAPRDLPMPSHLMVRIIHALVEGLTLQRCLTPELVPDEVFYAAFDALARTTARRKA